MYEPIFRLTEIETTKSRLIEIGDFYDPSLGFWNPHFTIAIMPTSACIIMDNHHTNERIEYRGQSMISRVLEASQYAYDVFYKKGRRTDKEKVGVVLTKNWERDYKKFLTKPLLRAISEIEKKYGKDWLTIV